jgi:hypothetical protein
MTKRTYSLSTRWDEGEWGDCSKTCNDGSPGQQVREVMCVITSNGVDELVEESGCQGPKPAVLRQCGLKECPEEWITVKSGPVSNASKLDNMPAIN